MMRALTEQSILESVEEGREDDEGSDRTIYFREW